MTILGHPKGNSLCQSGGVVVNVEEKGRVKQYMLKSHWVQNIMLVYRTSSLICAS